MTITRSLIYFAIAGLCEIDGGYVVWLVAGAQDSLVGARWSRFVGCLRSHPNFADCKLWSRLCSLRWSLYCSFYSLGWRINEIMPDRFDIVGGIIALASVFIMYWPR
jgi:small multidrug resistance family-3 protein